MKRRIAAALLLLAGIVASFAMGPQFLVFIPIVLGAWLLARFGLVPRRFQHRGTEIRMLGGPSIGSLRFADIRIHAESGQRRETAELVLALARALSGHSGGMPEVVAEEPTTFAAIERDPQRLLAAPGITLVWRPGSTDPANAASEVVARWRDAWPRATSAQDAQRAAVALEARWDPAADGDAAVGVLGNHDLVGSALVDVARELRDAEHASAWTSGWVRDFEREAAREDAARRRRSKARAG